MNKHDILAAIKKAGSSQTQIAKSLGLNEKSVRACVADGGTSKRVEAEISRVTGLPLNQLWPQWYGEGDQTQESTDPLESISARLSAERKRLGFDPCTMAAIGKITPEEQLRYECGAIAPDLLYLVRLSRATHLDALYIITGRREFGRAGG